MVSLLLSHCSLDLSSLDWWGSRAHQACFGLWDDDVGFYSFLLACFLVIIDLILPAVAVRTVRS